MGRLTGVTPVPPTLALSFAGGRAFMRKVLVHQTRKGEALAVMHGETPVALAMFDRQRARRVELALCFAPAAAREMRAFVRFAQLTLRRFAHAGVLVFVRIPVANRQGQRMAMITGFVPGGFRDPAIWIWKDKGT